MEFFIYSLRLLGVAAATVVGGMAVYALGGLFLQGPAEPSTLTAWFVIAHVLSGWVSWKIILYGWEPTQRVVSERELIAEGLLAYQHFRACRAVEIEPFEPDEGFRYFIELEDGTTLYLGGQYLFSLAEITDDPAYNQPAMFPNSDFTVRRHKKQGYATGVTCSGDYFPPETVLPPPSYRHVENGLIPEEDGTIIKRSLNQIIAEYRAIPVAD